MLRTRPLHGVALGWRPELAGDVLRDPDGVDFLEVVAETCFAQQAARREACALAEMLAGGAARREAVAGQRGRDRRASARGGWARWLATCARPRSASTSSLTRGGWAGHRAPDRAALHPRGRAGRGRQRGPREAPAARRAVPASRTSPGRCAGPRTRWTRATSTQEIAAATGCDLLLDLGNLYANALNAGVDPAQALRDAPARPRGMVHVAGRRARRRLLRGHARRTRAGGRVRPPRPAAGSRPARFPIVLERDRSFPDFAELAGEMQGRARRRVQRAAALRIRPERRPVRDSHRRPDVSGPLASGSAGASMLTDVAAPADTWRRLRRASTPSRARGPSSSTSGWTTRCRSCPPTTAAGGGVGALARLAAPCAARRRPHAEPRLADARRIASTRPPPDAALAEPRCATAWTCARASPAKTSRARHVPARSWAASACRTGAPLGRQGLRARRAGAILDRGGARMSTARPRPALEALPEPRGRRSAAARRAWWRPMGENLAALLVYGSAVRGGRYPTRATSTWSSSSTTRPRRSCTPCSQPLTPRALRRPRGGDDPQERPTSPPPPTSSPCSTTTSASRHVALSGTDPFSGLNVHDTHRRLRIEQELREARIRMRRAVVDAMGIGQRHRGRAGAQGQADPSPAARPALPDAAHPATTALAAVLAGAGRPTASTPRRSCAWPRARSLPTRRCARCSTPPSATWTPCRTGARATIERAVDFFPSTSRPARFLVFYAIFGVAVFVVVAGSPQQLGRGPDKRAAQSVEETRLLCGRIPGRRTGVGHRLHARGRARRGQHCSSPPRWRRDGSDRRPQDHHGFTFGGTRPRRAGARAVPRRRGHGGQEGRRLRLRRPGRGQGHREGA